jgi:hypothetical protein
MGGYQISYESFKTYVQNQARMAKAAIEKADEIKTRVFFGDGGEKGESTKYFQYNQEAEIRKDVVFELAKYLSAPEKEVKKMWLEAEC